MTLQRSVPKFGVPAPSMSKRFPVDFGGGSACDAGPARSSSMHSNPADVGEGTREGPGPRTDRDCGVPSGSASAI